MIELVKLSREHNDQLFPISPVSGRRRCKACNECGLAHCAIPEECGFAYAFDSEQRDES